MLQASVHVYVMLLEAGGSDRATAIAAQHAANEMHPCTPRLLQASVHVYVMLLEAGGSDLATAIAAASVALADAGISMYDLVPACLVVSAAGTLC